MAADRDRQLSFLGDAAPDPLALEDGRLTYAPAFFAPDVADRLLTELLASIEWHAESVHLFGKTHPVPRLVAWHGDAGTAYMYSGISHDPLPWTPALAAVRDQVAEAAGGELIYNASGVPLAVGLLYPLFGILIIPMFAAFAISASSISVVLNSLRPHNSNIRKLNQSYEA